MAGKSAKPANHLEKTSVPAKVNRLGKKASTLSDGVFGTVPIRLRGLTPVERLNPAYAEMARMADSGCEGALCNIVNTVEPGDDMVRLLNAVNGQVNDAITYRSDAAMHGVTDRWSTAAQTLARGYGDCEDYAIAKMAVLQMLGVDMKDMSIVVLLDEERDLFHAVLAVNTPRGRMILDNLHEGAVADTRLASYLPLYSVSDGEGFIHGRKIGKERRTASISPASFRSITPGEGPVMKRGGK